MKSTIPDGRRPVGLDYLELKPTQPKLKLGLGLSLAITEDDIKELLSIAMEIAVKFFWRNFTYTFGDSDFLQEDGGPIGARLTMCIARLILQDWSENFQEILKDNEILELLRGIYVDDGRSVVSKIENNKRFNITSKN